MTNLLTYSSLLRGEVKDSAKGISDRYLSFSEVLISRVVENHESLREPLLKVGIVIDVENLEKKERYQLSFCIAALSFDLYLKIFEADHSNQRYGSISF